MTGRRAANRIRGPHSALTDFLAANNISAQQIRDSYVQRVQAAADAEETQDPEDAEAAAAAEAEAAAAEAAEAEAAIERTKKRKRASNNAAAKVKAKKAAAKKKGKKDGDSQDDDDDDYDDAMENMYKKAKPMPGQFENCEVCSKRFTVTPYSKTGSEGGLLCTPCGKELVKDDKANAKAKKPKTTKGRRKVESNRLDGLVTSGAKSLQSLCIETAAKFAEDVDELGELADNEQIVDRLSQIFSKKRKLDSRTMRLFLRSGMDTVAFWDAAELQTEDYDLIIAIAPHLKKLILRNASQFKDGNLEYTMEKAKRLEYMHLHCTNLISNDMWIKFFQARGQGLRTVKLQWLDAAFDNDAVQALVQNCPNLSRLKFELCRQISLEGFEELNKLTKLEHLSLQLSHEIPCERLINLVGHIGASLQTLSLDGFSDGDDTFLSALHSTCTSLRKFRFTQNDLCTDAAFAALFTDWSNPPLNFIDVHGSRDVDSSNPEGPADIPVGLSTGGLTALMEHSGSNLEYLNISSCRHIPLKTFLDVFDGVKKYPKLKEIDISFTATPDTTVVAGMFRSCASLKKLVAFGCFGIEDVVVPAGVVVVGLPRAQDAIEMFGEDMDVDTAFVKMIEVSA